MKRFIIFFLLLAFISIKAQNNDPRPNPKSVVYAGNARFTVLTDRLIRMEWSDDGRFEDLASLVFINRNLPNPSFSQKRKGSRLVIETEKMKLSYDSQSGRFTAQNLSISFQLNGKSVNWNPSVRDSLNLKGTTRTLDNTDGEKDVKLEDGLLSRSGWCLIDDSKTNLLDQSNWVVQRQTEGKQDWYFFAYGHDYKKQLADYTQLAGKIPMPPRFAFGYWWSRYWAYSDGELRSLVQDMRLHNMPLDVMVIDMDWHNTYGLSLNHPQKDEFGEMIGWTGYSWNKQLFPKPKEFLDWTASQHIKTALNLHPASGIAPMEDVYADFAKAYSFDTAQHKNIPMRIEDKKWVDVYFNKVLHPIEKQGIDFWWLDWQQWLENKSIKNLSNTSWLNHIFFTDMEQAGEKRPLLFHRWGGLGNHRYQIGFSGDSHSSWDALDYQSYFTATASNVGYGYWSHDIGGHIGDDADPELYLRWIQFGVFSPILRTHCSKSKDIERRMFMYPKHFNMMLDALQMRYALNPYIYKASREAYETGVSLCRPMYYDYPEAEQAYRFPKQYLFGDDMLLAPIASKAENNLSIKKIWLPEGQWYEWYTGAMLKGNKEYTRAYCLNEIPLFVKAGAIVPMYPKNIKNLQEISDTLVLCFIPGKDGQTSVYEDDGHTSDYKSNKYASFTVKKQTKENGDMHISISSLERNYTGMKDKMYYELYFPSNYPPRKVGVNQQEYPFDHASKNGAWTYDAEKLAVRIFIPATDRREKLEVVLCANDKNKGQESHLYGKIGIISRSAMIIEQLKYGLNSVDPFANLSLSISKIGALKTNILYSPENTLEILTDFENGYSQLIHDIQYESKIGEHEVYNILRLFVNEVNILSKPNISLSSATSSEAAKVRLSSDVSDAKIYYTTDNSIPTIQSNLYRHEFDVAKTCVIKARSFKDANQQSSVSEQSFHRTYAQNLHFQFAPHAQYEGGKSETWIDGKFGDAKDFRHQWLGFESVDLDATIELKKPSQLKSISVRFLECHPQWIFAPQEVSFEVSSDGETFRKVFYQDLRNQSQAFNREERLIPITAQVEESSIKFIRIKAKNTAVCPIWHYGSGGKAWMFTDELVVE